jgi:hypothetical protein
MKKNIILKINVSKESEGDCEISFDVYLKDDDDDELEMRF